MMTRIMLSCGLLASVLAARAWDYEGHRAINELALANLPPEFPAFVRTAAARERIAFLGGEPDRWRNTADLALRHFNNPDHYIDLEELRWYQFDPGSLPHLRYEFVSALAVKRAGNPSGFPRIDPRADTDRTKALVGFLPWAITEQYGK